MIDIYIEGKIVKAAIYGEKVVVFFEKDNIKEYSIKQLYKDNDKYYLKETNHGIIN